MELIENKGITLSEDALRQISQTAKWAQFLAIIGFVVTALIVVAGLFMGSFMSVFREMGGGTAPMPRIPYMAVSVIYVIMGGIYFIPSWFLYKFSTETRKALIGNDEEILTQAFANLRRTFKFMGIMTIVIIGLYVLVIIAVTIGAAAGAAF
ncbi:DUF5362 family protein [Prolixibacter denitrificans]|uniref:DUF5362 domain-containing protein n=1 Tax=Prolixibacter denitrificans TaxID=1541063 RepID=A0A2P8C9V6_9BACT|nr:DUF5362 family protein [Prolixibacter denitrificans]PSK81750.1 hypothetical protein CLV93_108151 [Prolixibacter denitrificans]GET21271.1 hypothetical protein JCM18694_15170 [Prolixibacter denitrificans]